MPIFDQGYQHWNGELTKPSKRWLTIARHGIAVGKKNILLRLAILCAWLPAIMLAGFLCVWGLIEQKSDLVQPIVPFIGSIVGQDVVDNAKDYRVEVWTLAYEYFLLTELRFSMLVVLLVGPSLISQDLRFNALPLYFSRPIRRIDYFLGKFGVIAYFLGMVLIVPSVIAWVLGNVFSLDFSIIKDTWSLLVASIAYGILMTLSAGLLILAMSSLSRSSRYVGLFWLGIWFVTSIVGTVMEGISREERMNAAYRKSWELERSLQQSPQAKNMTNEERMKQQTEMRETRRRLMAEAAQEEMDAAKHDWRPMVSYTGNLSRIGQQWLGSDKSWERFAQSVPEEYRAQWLLGRQGPRYPWYWSMVLLLVLIGISVCILNFRVKSLDRLK